MWALRKLSSKVGTTSVTAVRAMEIRAARHPESINDNKRVKGKGYF